jgi:hypothetical protein
MDFDDNISAFIKFTEITQNRFTKLDASLLRERVVVYTGSEWIVIGDLESQFFEFGGGLISDWRHIEQNTMASPLGVNVRVHISDVLEEVPDIK